MSRRSRSVVTALLACVLLVAGPVGTALARSPNAHPKATPSATATPTAGPVQAPTPVVVVETAAPSVHVPPGQAKKQTAAPAGEPTPTATPKANNGQGKADGQGNGNGQANGNGADKANGNGADKGNGPEKSPDPGAEAKPTDAPKGPSAGGPTQQLACGNGKPELAPAPTPAPTETPTPEPTPTAEPTPIVIPGAKASSALDALSALTGNPAVKAAGSLLQRFKDQAIRDFCNANALRNTLGAEIDSRLRDLAAMEKLLVRAGLSEADLATIHAKLSAVADDLRAMASRVEAATTLAALEIERAALASMNQLLPTMSRWMSDVRAAEATTVRAQDLRNRELTMLALMTTLPPDRAAVVAPLLEQLGEFLDAGRTAARSALGSLLAVPAADLESGAATSTLAAAESALATADAALAQATALADQVQPLVE